MLGAVSEEALQDSLSDPLDVEVRACRATPVTCTDLKSMIDSLNIVGKAHEDHAELSWYAGDVLPGQSASDTW